MNSTRRAVIASGLMGAASIAAHVLTPTVKLAAAQGVFDLEQVLPLQFGVWRVDRTGPAGIVNPQQDELIKRLYSQTLSRTYVDSRGRRVMLSIAYGEDQRDGMEAHFPEVCYPAQGFRVVGNRKLRLETGRGAIEVRRLETVYNNQRYEPVTYWMMLGDVAHLGGVAKRLAEIKIGLKGYIADGLLFRVSSIGRDSAVEFGMQAEFIDQLLSTLPDASLKRISGLPNIAAS